MRISLSKFGVGFSVAPGESLLSAALAAGLDLPHRCKRGNCGACRARLLRGRIGYVDGTPLGLPAAEAAEGYVLLCRAHAESDVDLEFDAIVHADAARIKRLPCRVERAELLSHDVVALILRLPAAAEFKFRAGQTVDILPPGGGRRSFSIASPADDSKRLELHVRRVAGDEFIEGLFGADARNRLLQIEGPFDHAPAAALRQRTNASTKS